MKKLFIPLLIIISAALSGHYLFFRAQDRYLAEAQFSVVIEEQTNVDASMGLESLLSGATLGSADTQAAIGYIQSADLLLELEREFDLVTHFSAPTEDWIYNLRSYEGEPSPIVELRNKLRLFPVYETPPVELRLEYYRQKFAAKLNSTSGLIGLTVETYDPQLSYKVSQAILKKTEEFINRQNREIAEEHLRFVNVELQRAQSVIHEQEKALLAFQNEHKIIQPEAIIKAQLEAIQTLRLERIHKEIELTTLRASSPKSPLIRSLRSTISELKSEIASQEASLSGEDQKKLNQLQIKFKELTLNLEFAVQLKKGAEILLEKARADAASTSRFFSIVQTPYIPERHTYPRRWYLLASTIFVTTLLLLLIRAFVRSIYDRT